jgi:predicted membrane-bound mannosyltransferase
MSQSTQTLTPPATAGTWANGALGVALGAAILAGLFLRWQHIADHPLTVDEVFSLSFTRYSFAEMWTSPLDANPPLYYALLKLATNLGTSDTTLRLPSLLFGGLGLLAIYLLARMFFGRLTSLFAAALVAVHHYHIDYSEDARAYSLLFLLVTNGQKQQPTQNGSRTSFFCYLAALVPHIHDHKFERKIEDKSNLF